MVQGQPRRNRHLLREKKADRASQEQCGFSGRKPIQMAVRELRKGFMEEMLLELILKVQTDRNEIQGSEGVGYSIRGQGSCTRFKGL